MSSNTRVILTYAPMPNDLPATPYSLDTSAITALIPPGKKDQHEQTVRSRTAWYLLIAVALIIIHSLSLMISFEGTLQLYSTLELTSILLSFVVSVMALIKYRTRHLDKYLMIGFGFLTVATIDTLNLISLHTFFPVIKTNHILNHWIHGQIVLAAFCITSLVVWKYRMYVHNKKIALYGPIVIATLIITISYLTPQRFLGTMIAVTALIFLISAIGYIIKGFWKRKYFEHWLVIALFIFTYSEFVRLSSQDLYDAPMMVAQTLKVMGTMATLTGLLMSMYIAFKQVEEAGNKINTILASVGEGVIVLDRLARILFMNSAAETLTGFTSDKSLNTSIEELIHITDLHNHETLSDSIKKVLSKRTLVLLDHQVLQRKDQKQIYVSYSIAPIIDDHNTLLGIALVIHDSSHEHELEQTKDNFLSVVAHQLRTPLGAMRWNLELLLANDFGKLTTKVKRPIEETYQNNHRMVNLVNDLLNVLRIDQRRVVDSPKATDLYQVVANICESFRFEALSRNIEIMLFPPKPIAMPITADTERLVEIVENLISNATKYNKDNGTVSVTLSTSNEFYMVTVEDTGIGIPHADQSNIFTRFFRATNARTSNTTGSGLGLFVVQSYVKGWGGSVSFKSQENKGTTIELMIPKKPKRLKSSVLGKT